MSRYDGHKSRIEITDTLINVVTKITDGNPGAIRVCLEIYQHGNEIDSLAWHGGLVSLLELDSIGIYGSRIWMLYKDVCKESIEDTIAMLRAVQLGILSDKDLEYAIDNYGKGINVVDLKQAVITVLKGKFGMEYYRRLKETTENGTGTDIDSSNERGRGEEVSKSDI